MTIAPTIYTQHQWVDKIETLIPDVAHLNLRRSKDCRYGEIVSGKNVFNDSDAFSLSNSIAHDDLIRRCVVALQKKTGDAYIKHLLGELTYRKTYGAFSEMAAYDWMAQAGIDFTPQVPLGPADVVNPRGSSLDGKFLANGKTVFFDIKAFGFVEHLIAILKEKLEENADGDEVMIQGGMAVSIDDLRDLIEPPGFDLLIEELRSKSWAQRGTLTFLKRQRRQVSVSVLDLDLKKLAAENRQYALKSGAQFTRRAPFILFFVIHPWFAQGPLFHFAENHDIFCTEFARLTFQSFDHDTTVREGMPTDQLMKLLSAIAFINVWPEPSPEINPTARMYLNATALHSILPSDFASLQTRLGSQISIIQI